MSSKKNSSCLLYTTPFFDICQSPGIRGEHAAVYHWYRSRVRCTFTGQTATHQCRLNGEWNACNKKKKKKRKGSGASIADEMHATKWFPALQLHFLGSASRWWLEMFPIYCGFWWKSRFRREMFSLFLGGSIKVVFGPKLSCRQNVCVCANLPFCCWAQMANCNAVNIKVAEDATLLSCKREYSCRRHLDFHLTWLFP